MKLSFALLLCAGLVVTAREDEEKKHLVVYGKQSRWLANDIKAHHEEMRKTHEDYVPNYPDAPILTVISIGTPAVDYWVSLETGSEATFVLAKNYSGRSANQSFFDPAQSSTAEFAGDYLAFSGELEASGAAYIDVVGLFGWGDEFNATQRFGVVDRIFDLDSIHLQMPDGVLGLSWDPADAIISNENSSTILNFFGAYGQNKSRYWCQWMESATDPVYGHKYASATEFGGCLECLCDARTESTRLPLLWVEKTRSLAFWLDAFTYAGTRHNGGVAKVDTGVPTILLPYVAFLAVYNDVEPFYDFEHGLYTVNCNRAGTLPDWVFQIAGVNYTIPSSAYVVDLLLPNDQCAFSLSFSDPAVTTDYVLGYVFHTLWCIKMDVDYQSISFLDVLLQPTAEPPVEEVNVSP